MKQQKQSFHPRNTSKLSWSSLFFCGVLVPGTLAFHLLELYLDSLITCDYLWFTLASQFVTTEFASL